jgi:hypothetical protein
MVHGELQFKMLPLGEVLGDESGDLVVRDLVDRFAVEDHACKHTGGLTLQSVQLSTQLAWTPGSSLSDELRA